MPTEHGFATPSIFALVLFVAVAWIVAWLITRRRSDSDTARGRWLRFSVYGIFWLVLICAVLVREWQYAQQTREAGETIMRLQDELDVAKMRSDTETQGLRDQVEYLENTLKNQTQSATPSTPEQ